jgi:hypothetical protein
MRLVHAPIALVAAALALSGCTTAQPTSAGAFKGAESDVAAVVDDISSAARKGDPEKMCNDLFTKELADRFKAGAADCADQLRDAIRDASAFDMDVQDVTVTGNTATAKVRQDKGGRTGTISFEKIGSGWRASAIS